MGELHRNLIGGEWVGGEAVPNINPSDTNDVVGDYARATKADAEAAIAAAKAAFPKWSRSGLLERHAVLRKASDEIIARKEELGKLLSREEGKTLAEGIGETVRAAQIFDFFAGEALRLTGETVPSVRPGIGVEMTREAVGVVGIITPWNFPIAIPAWKIAPALCHGNTVVFKPADLVPGCVLGDRRHPAPRRPAQGRAQPRHGQGLGGRPGDARQPRRQRHHLHRLGRHRQARGRGLRRAHAQVPARDGRQEPAGRARRCRSRDRRRLRRQRRLLLDRPALHGLVAADRPARHPRQVRGGGDREAEEPGRRQRAEARHADRPGGRREPARPGRALYRDRPRRRRQAGVRRRAAEPRNAGLLPAAGAVHRSDQRRCASAARRSSGRWPR